MLKVDCLTFSYASPSKEASFGPFAFELELGQGLALIGPSGSGKSTLLQLLAGRLDPTEGSVFFENREVRPFSGALTQEREGIRLLSQGLDLMPYTPVVDTFQRALRHLPQEQRLEEIARIAGEFSISGLMVSKPEELSSGQKQRCGLALCFLSNVRLALLDEPFSHQDALNRQRLQQAIRISQKIKPRIIVLATHTLEDLTEISDKILHLDKGKQNYLGNQSEVFDKKINVNKPLTLLAMLGPLSGLSFGETPFRALEAEKGECVLIKSIQHNSNGYVLNCMDNSGRWVYVITQNAYSIGDSISIKRVLLPQNDFQ